MKTCIRSSSIACTILVLGSPVLDWAIVYSQDKEGHPASNVLLNLKAGYQEDGSVTPAWTEAIKNQRRSLEAPLPSFEKKKLQPEEMLWSDLINRRISKWSAMIDSLRVPFGSAKPPGFVTILIGNQNGQDAFVYSDSTICFDLNRLNHVYGSASRPQNQDRIDRFFAHEFTHILHKAWRKEHPVKLDSPLEIALWDCLTEGLGNYRSLSDKWVTNRGLLTEHAFATLTRLQTIFVERIAALQHALNEEAKPLMEGLSMGKFDEKWGALTVALWLAQETKGTDSNLKKWVDFGPAGILELARKYLPVDLVEKIPTANVY